MRPSRSLRRIRNTHYSLGSVLNHVMLHQTVIGQEAMVQLEEAGDAVPDTVFGCAGGGSNLAGLTFPFLGRNLREGSQDSSGRLRAFGMPRPSPRASTATTSVMSPA